MGVDDTQMGGGKERQDRQRLDGAILVGIMGAAARRRSVRIKTLRLETRSARVGMVVLIVFLVFVIVGLCEIGGGMRAAAEAAARQERRRRWASVANVDATTAVLLAAQQRGEHGSRLESGPLPSSGNQRGRRVCDASQGEAMRGSARRRRRICQALCMREERGRRGEREG